MDQTRDQQIGDNRDGKHEIVVLQLGAQRQISETRQSDRNRGNVGQRQRTLRQLDPIQRHQADHFGKGNRHDHEIGAAHTKRQQPNEISAQSSDEDCQCKTDDRRPGLVNDAESERQAGVEAKRRQCADIGANAEECDMTEAELAGEPKQKIEAHRADDKDPGRDQRVHEIRIAQPQRHRCKRDDRENGDR